MKSKFLSLKNIWVFTVLIVVAVFSVMFFRSMQEYQNHQPKFTGSYNVEFQMNQQDSSLTDVYLVDKSNADNRHFYASLKNIYTNHYHTAQYVNGDLYILKRVGDTSTENWIDELWRYTNPNHGAKISSQQGLDFLASPNNEAVAVVKSTDSLNDRVEIIGSSGGVISTFSTQGLGLGNDHNIDPLIWDDGEVWLTVNVARQLSLLLQHNPDAQTTNQFSVSELSIVGHDFDLNPSTKTVIYSDHVPALDTLDEKELNDTSNNLYLHNLETEEEEHITSSQSRHRFNPKWIDGTTIEYNDPETGERVEKVVE